MHQPIDTITEMTNLVIVLNTLECYLTTKASIAPFTEATVYQSVLNKIQDLKDKQCNT